MHRLNCICYFYKTCCDPYQYCEKAKIMFESHSCNSNCCKLCHQNKVSVFNELDAVTLDKLDAIKSVMVCSKGSVVFNEGSFPKGLFCIEYGKIKITQTGLDGKNQIVRMLKGGDVLGHRAIFGDDEYSCSAYAMEDTKLCFFPKNQFNSISENNGKFIHKFAQILAAELKEAERKITSTAQQSVLCRVAGSLLFLLENYGFEKDLQTLNVRISREELAEMVGTTRESATRALYQLKNASIILLNGKKILVIDKKGLFDATV